MGSASPNNLHVYSVPIEPGQATETKVREIGGHPHLLRYWSQAHWDVTPRDQRPPTAERFAGGYLDIQPIPGPGLSSDA